MNNDHEPEQPSSQPTKPKTGPVGLQQESNATTTTPPPGPADLLASAAQIQAHARRLENLATWQAWLERHCREKADGETRDAARLLRFAQAMRDSGQGNGDAPFFFIALLAERWAENATAQDRKPAGIRDAMKAIERREGLEEDDSFLLNAPGIPADWTALNEEWERRFVEIEDRAVIAFLLAHGEPDMAVLYQRERVEFDRRREAGRRLVHPDDAAAPSVDSGEGDTGLT